MANEVADNFERTLVAADMRGRDKNEIASELLGRRLARAIAEGSERDIAAEAPFFDTERPLFVLAFMPQPAEQIPTTPQCANHIAYLLWRRRRQEFRDELRWREAERQSTRPRPPEGEYTVFDLTADTCHYVTRERPYFFCGGKPEAAEKPYCRHHANICYQRVA